MSFGRGIVEGLPGAIHLAQQSVAGSKRKWRTRRLALAWLHDPEWTMPETPQALQAALREWPKWRVRLWTLEHGEEELARVIKAWRQKMDQRDELDELIARRLEEE